MNVSKKRPEDQEIRLMDLFCRELATVAPPARRRVLAYVNARAEALPMVAAIGGGTVGEGGDQQVGMFDEIEPPGIEFPSQAGRRADGDGAQPAAS